MASQVHRLFFALKPDAAAAEAIARTVEMLQATQRIRGRWLPPAKLHLTVQFLGDLTAPDAIVQRARSAAESLRIAPFEFTFDRVASFSRRLNSPCVLRCAPGSEASLQELARELAVLLSAAGLGEYLETRPYVPHLTIAYAQNALPEPIAIEPIIWQACAIGLVDSHGGQHAQIDSWPLRP